MKLDHVRPGRKPPQRNPDPRSARLDSGNLGFFSKPVRLTSGPDRGRIAKIYRPIADQKLCQIVSRNHGVYLAKLNKAGIRVPPTELRIVPLGRRWMIRIVQDAFREDELVRGIIMRSDSNRCLRVLGSLLDDTLKFLSWKRQSGETVGFHPTLRNYAFRNGKVWYFDTFPPMWGWDQKGLNRIIITFAPFGIFRFLRFLSGRWVNRVTNEYFRDDLMITGIIGSACRLRPDLADGILSFSRSYLTRRIREKGLLRRILAILSRPPRLPGVWVFLRGLVGKEGRPNIR